MRISGFGWLEFIVGVLLVGLGAFTLSSPLESIIAIVLAYGILAILMGIGDIVMYIRVERFTGFGPMVSLVSGILSVMSGIMLVAYPDAGAIVLTILFPIWFITHCAARLARLSSIRAVIGRGVYYALLVLNIIGIILGFLLIFMPRIALVSAAWIAGLYLMLLGIESIVFAFSKVGRGF